MSTFWRNFYLRHIILLLVTAFGLMALFHYSALDLYLADPWYDATRGIWPHRRSIWALTLHRGLRIVLLIVALGCWYAWWRHRHQPEGRRYLLLAGSSALIPILVASGKRFSPLHCAWDVDRYGGYAPYADVLTRIPDGIAPGHCFPAAFLTSASWLMALGLLFYPERRRLAILLGLSAFCLALALGWVQQMRGAHFFSHTLWSLWLSWAVIISLHYVLRLWRAPHGNCLGHPI